MKASGQSSNFLENRSNGRNFSNNLDKLAKKLLPWDMMKDLTKSGRHSLVTTDDLKFSVLPTTFPSFASYLQQWEPLFIAELRANVLSEVHSIPKARAQIGTIQLSPEEDVPSDTIVKADALLHSSPSQSQKDNISSPNVMDLILLSSKTIEPPNSHNKEFDRPSSTSSSSSSSSSSSATATSGIPAAGALALIVGIQHKQGQKIYQLLVASKQLKLVVVAQTNDSNGNNGSNSNGGYGSNDNSHCNNSGVINSTGVEPPKQRHAIVRGYANTNNNKSNQTKKNTTVPSTTTAASTQSLSYNAFKVIDLSSSFQPAYVSSSSSTSSSNKKRNNHHLHYMVLTNIRSQWREFQALHEVGVSKILPEILSTYRTAPSIQQQHQVEEQQQLLPATRFTLEEENEMMKSLNATQSFMNYLKGMYNTSQLHAMHTAVSRKGFSLIQGPPGTGKTKTILGILNGIHLREFNKYYDDLLLVFLGDQGKQLLQHQNNPLLAEQMMVDLLARLAHGKPRILVVAPSNVAVDHIVEQLIEDGFKDGNGGRYSPPIVRIGARSKADAVEKVTLEYLMEEQLYRHVSHDAKKQHLEAIKQELSLAIQQAFQLQVLLLNLTMFFNLCHPLPKGWELRVHRLDGKPYWTDHQLRIVTTTPPKEAVAAILQEPANKHRELCDYFDVEELPEYRQYAHDCTHLLTRIEDLNQERNRLATLLSNNAISTSSSLSHGQMREMMESSIIDNAQLLFSTLNSCGQTSMESTQFSVTVIDEAAQCVEPSTLIALRRGCRQCVMVGDQIQLPATIFHEPVKEYHYDRSLFERLILSGHPYVMLDTQYRMRPEISAFPSRLFYQGQLKDGDNVSQVTYSVPYIRPNLLQQHLQQQQAQQAMDKMIRYEPVLNTVMFFDLQYSTDTNSGRNSSKSDDQPGGEEEEQEATSSSSKNKNTNSNSLSKVNIEEAKFCIRLVELMIKEIEFMLAINDRLGVGKGGGEGEGVGLQQPNSSSHTVADLLGHVGMITPYSEQLVLLRKQVSSSPFLKPYRRQIELNTVDGFQGREKDIMIISTVRANEEGNIGFLVNKRRMNVALTRAKKGLFVVGHVQTLSYHKNWYEYIQHIQQELHGLVSIPHRPNGELFSFHSLLIEHQQFVFGRHYPSNYHLPKQDEDLDTMMTSYSNSNNNTPPSLSYDPSLQQQHQQQEVDSNNNNMANMYGEQQPIIGYPRPKKRRFGSPTTRSASATMNNNNKTTSIGVGLNPIHIKPDPAVSAAAAAVMVKDPRKRKLAGISLANKPNNSQSTAADPPSSATASTNGSGNLPPIKLEKNDSRFIRDDSSVTASNRSDNKLSNNGSATANRAASIPTTSSITNIKREVIDINAHQVMPFVSNTELLKDGELAEVDGEEEPIAAASAIIGSNSSTNLLAINDQQPTNEDMTFPPASPVYHDESMSAFIGWTPFGIAYIHPDSMLYNRG